LGEAVGDEEKATGANRRYNAPGLVFWPGTALLAVLGLFAKLGVIVAHRTVKGPRLLLALLREGDLAA
jgi:hypothetical protein